MEKSKNYEKYKKYYLAGWYTEEMLWNIARKGKITEEEVKEIIASKYINYM